MPNITTSYLPEAVQLNADRNLLSTPTRNFIYTLGASRKTMESQNGHIKRMTRLHNLPEATTALGNSGLTPPPQMLLQTFVDAEMSIHGAYISVNEQVPLTNESPILNAMGMHLGKQMRTTEDALARNMLNATSTVFVCDGGGNGDNPTNISVNDILGVTTHLRNTDAATVAEMEDASENFGTSPVPASYFCYSHTEMIPEFSNLPGFEPAYRYGDQRNILKSELGNIAYARILTTSGGIVERGASTRGQDVYANIFTAYESYAIIDQDSFGPRFLYTPKEIAGGALHQNCTMGWKTAMATAILYDQHVVKLTSTLS